MDHSKYHTRQCPQCNKIIYHKRKKDRNYAEKLKNICRECSDKNQAEKYGFSPKEEFICFTCKKSFMEWRSQISNTDTPFCSKQCYCNNGTNNLVGERFGKLLVLERERRDRTTFYKCKCDCGNITTVTHTNLQNSTSSCGCLVKETRGSERKPLKEVIERAIWNYYKRNAKTRNYEWHLDYKDFIKLINSNCHYCGAEKQTLFIHRYKNETASLPFNGVDRQNNKIGYTIENCVGCCKICNRAKLDMSLDDFIAWSNKLSNHLNERQ